MPKGYSPLGRHGALEQPKNEAVVFDLENPRSVLRLVTPSVREAILSLPPQYLNLSEKEFAKTYKPSAQENAIRRSFWREYDVAQQNMSDISMVRVYAGLCTREFFYDVLLHRHHVVGWMIIPPNDYITITEEALDFGLSRIREIMELPLVDAKGKVNTRVCDLIIKATAMLDMRMKGAYVQRSEVKQLNFNMAGDAEEIGKLIQQTSMEEINSRLKYLERKERKELLAEETTSLQAAPVIELTPELEQERPAKPGAADV